MQLVRIFIIATIIAFVPVLAAPVAVDSQELVVRESSVSRFFNRIGAKIRGAFKNLGKRIRSIGKRKKQKKPEPPVETRELGVVFAREDADGLYVRWSDGDEISTREFDDDFEAREFDDDEFEAREFDDELDAREPAPYHQHPRELSYDTLD